MKHQRDFPEGLEEESTQPRYELPMGRGGLWKDPEILGNIVLKPRGMVSANNLTEPRRGA